MDEVIELSARRGVGDYECEGVCVECRSRVCKNVRWENVFLCK